MEVDPLAVVAVVPAVDLAASAPEADVSSTNQEQHNLEQQHEQQQNILALVSERLVVERTPEEDEMVDPIERFVRFVVPIPKRYYWDVCVNEQEQFAAVVPRRIKFWHHAIASSVAVGEWTNRNVAQPVASAMGLTSSRFHFVTDQMSPQDMERSRRMVQERRLNQGNDSRSENGGVGVGDTV